MKAGTIGLEDGDAVPAQRSAADQAYLHLVSAIRVGRYRPGQRLIMEDIAARIGLSRMPVQEAMRRLAAEGLATMRPNRGCVVSSLSGADIYEIFEMRSVLEGLAVRLAMPRIDAAVLAELDWFLHRMERSAAAGGEEWVTYHREFHEYICGLSDRPKLLQQIAGLHTATEPYMRMWFHHVQTSETEHRDFVDILRTGDAARAETAMRMHILATAPVLVAFIEQHPEFG